MPDNMKSVDDVLDATFDDANDMLARLRLTTELGQVRKEIIALGESSADTMARLKLTVRLGQIRKQLRGGVPVPPEPAPTPGAEHAAYLREVANGQHDAEDLGALLDKIEAAVNALNDAGLLAGDADQAANDAITHWVTLDEKQNG